MEPTSPVSEATVGAQIGNLGSPADGDSGRAVVEILRTDTTDFGSWMSVEKRRLLLPSNHQMDAHVIRFPDIALVAAVSGSSVILIRQYRFPAGQWLLEAPAGRVEPGEDPAVTAARELGEETGYSCDALEKLGELRLSPHLSCEVTHVYLAREVREGTAHPERGELVETVEVPVADLRGMVARGQINDAKTVAALVLARLL